MNCVLHCLFQLNKHPICSFPCICIPSTPSRILSFQMLKPCNLRLLVSELSFKFLIFVHSFTQSCLFFYLTQQKGLMCSQVTCCSASEYKFNYIFIAHMITFVYCMSDGEYFYLLMPTP